MINKNVIIILVISLILVGIGLYFYQKDGLPGVGTENIDYDGTTPTAQ